MDGSLLCDSDRGVVDFSWWGRGAPGGPSRRSTHNPASTSGGGGEVAITERGEYRYIESNGLPDHNPGRFPNSGNPHRIEEQDYTFRVPLEPTARDEPVSAGRMVFGVALNGVVFDPGTAEYWRRDRESGWRYEGIQANHKKTLGLDRNNAHVQPNGAYHYHALPVGFVEARGGIEQMLLIGYAADGFPIYGPYAYADPADPDSGLEQMRPSWQLKAGTRPGGDRGPGGRYDGTFTQDFEFVEGSGDLDRANGRFGVTPEYPEGTYYYVLTEDFPFVPRYFRGTPDDSFGKRGGGGPPQGGPGGGPGGGMGGPGDGPRPRHHRPPPRR